MDNSLLVSGIIFLAGLIIGIVVTIIITRIYKPYYKQDLSSISSEIQKNIAALNDSSFQSALGNIQQFSDQVITRHTELSEQHLESKKQLIDQSIKEIRDNLKSVEGLMNDLEKNRERSFGQLSQQLQLASEQTIRLQDTTGKLQSALGNTRIRGQWGERMADDILRDIGFIEGINYLKQNVDESTGNRPDYTFLMPHDLKLNMDVKFPLDNYLKSVNADAETDQEFFKSAFLKDARGRIKEVTSKSYINPEDNTVDYVLVLIPNEQVYRFINENDPSILDFSLQQKVILCSPVTLYAILALIRQALDNFKMEKATNEILQMLGVFEKQWQKYADSMDRMGKKLNDAVSEYKNLTDTRKNQLERPLKKLDNIRRERGIQEIPLLEAEIVSEVTMPESEDKTEP